MESAATEQIAIESWRVKQFTALGFTDDEVATLLLYDIDYHEAALLLKGGCAHSTAIKILRP
jgi:hypothetical protein